MSRSKNDHWKKKEDENLANSVDWRHFVSFRLHLSLRRKDLKRKEDRKRRVQRRVEKNCQRCVNMTN